MSRLLLLALLPLLVSSSDFSCDRVHPSLWCANANLAQTCGFKPFCDRFNNATTNKPLKLTLLFEGLCPGCHAFITQELYPKIFPNFPKEVLQIELVPFGNAKYYGDKLVCQHGSEECQIDKFESCAIETLPSQADFVPLIYCIESKTTPMGVAGSQSNNEFTDAVAKCFSSLRISADVQNKIQTCYSNGRGDQLQRTAGDRTKDVFPEQHKYVPWIMVNDVSLLSFQQYSSMLPSLFCDWYSGSVKIPYCDNQMPAPQRVSFREL